MKTPIKSTKQTKTKVVVLGLIKNDKGDYLISLRSDPKIPEAHLKWDLPGGTVEFGETLEQTVLREIKEEAGIKVDLVGMLPYSTSKVWKHNDYDIHVILFCYLCKYKSGKAHSINPEVADLKWVKEKNLCKFDFLPTVDFFLNKYFGNG